MRARSIAGRRAQAGCALLAEMIALSTSAAGVSKQSAIFSPVDGFNTGILAA
jgi:hypothetical protein